MRVLVLTGAGVSAESGIPTFRGRAGYWRNLDPAHLATPGAFTRDPKLVWEWYCERRQRIGNAQPNAAHEAITRLAHHSDDFLLVTQNVDDLHARAGLPKEKMVQIHGDIFVTRCSRCDVGFTDREHEHEQEEEEEEELKVEEQNVVPRCGKCDALMRPGVVWFGEQLPWNEVQRVQTFLNRGVCDLVIVAGTTATFGYIVDWALRAIPERSRGELIEVNPEETPLSWFATQLVREPAAIALPRIVDAIIQNR
ncbi:MAG TPA: Sir2 family NAD-dependent protein deacetylase [Candidatus Udaeobacter sp.]|nr:Sir2 family NAD-dependent protein deacetylase [Candidatus Udaeobacter sp.]